MIYDFTIVGGGIVGLSTAMAVTRRFPDARILVLEKESHWAFHQSGHNSGVIHSGIYCKPGSYKAKFARAANTSLIRFCEENHIPYKMCGKLVVTRHAEEMSRLEFSLQRGLANGLSVRKLGPEEIKEIEPHVRVLGALYVPEAGIVDYRQVCQRFAEIVAEHGGELRLSTAVQRLQPSGSGTIIHTSNGEFETRFLIACAGLQADRLHQMEGFDTKVRTIPFRGDYYGLKPARSDLVRSLIYPLPHVIFPFLGVHLVRSLDGHVHAGPNAVLNPSREGYHGEFDLNEFAEIVSFPGIWRFAKKYWREGAAEMWRSSNKAAFLRAVQLLVPEIQDDDLEASPSGIRAQTFGSDGNMMDDFVFVDGPHSIHVLNAPSPAATCCIEIGKAVADRAASRYGGPIAASHD
jgi:L-2-hydroxyglutarate oxidase